MRHLRIVLLSFTLISAIACSKAKQIDETREFKTAPTEKVRITTDKPSNDNLTALSSSINQFGFNIISTLLPKHIEQDQNITISPLSLHEVLTMATLGSANTTKDEMLATLLIPELNSTQLDSYNYLDSLLNHQTGVKLNLANSVWAQDHFQLKQNFTNNLMENFGSPVYLVDYINNPLTALKDINDWTSLKTNGLIPNILSESDISPLTRIILVNTIYFYGKWYSPFEKELTENLDFTTATGKIISAPTMIQEDYFQYVENDQYQSIVLPYGEPNLPLQDNKQSMVIILPQIGSEDSVMKNLKPSDFINPISTETQKVNLHLPKFNIKGEKLNLNETLKDLGMKSAFNETADFSEITDQAQLIIDKVIHLAKVRVDEKGTEAAAASVASFLSTCPPPVDEIKQMFINRPFYFAIIDHNTQSILFIGMVNNPLAN